MFVMMSEMRNSAMRHGGVAGHVIVRLITQFVAEDLELNSNWGRQDVLKMRNIVRLYRVEER